MKHLPLPAWIYDPETLRFLAVSRSATVAYGYSREEFLAMTLDDIRPPAEVESLRTHLRGESGEAGRSEWIHRRKDGSTFSAQVSAEAMTFQGRPARIVIATDVTTRVQAAEALKQSEEHFRNIADHVPAMLWSSTPDSRSTWVNRQWLRFRGTTLEEELGLGWADAVHPDDLGRYMEECQTAFAARVPMETEFRARDKDGRWRQLLSSGEPYYAPDGTYLGFLGMCVDVTDLRDALTAQVLATEEVQRQKELLQTVFEQIPAMVVLFDDKGRVTTVNREFERVLGYDSEAARQGDLVTTLYPDPEAAAAVRAFVTRADSAWGDFTARAKDGRAVETTWSNVLLSNGQRVGIGQDVTDRKRLEREFRQAQKMESVGRLAGGIAHDFNNLLTAILGFSSLAARDVAADSPVRRALDEVRKAGERAASLTRQLLVFSRKQVVMPETVDLAEVMHDITGMLRRMIGEDVRLHSVAAVPHATVRADRGQIEQVLLNLAVNARDAMPQGGDLRVVVERVGDAEPAGGGPRLGGHVVLTVSDTGVGMSEEVRSHIFEPFFTTKPLGEGTGLGLATVYGIVQQSGGFVDVETELGKGTTFRVSLPWHSRDASPVPALDVETRDTSGHETVLLIEDEEAVRRLVGAVLEGNGYRVLRASSGEEALLLASDSGRTIDLVLSDLVMPGANGRQIVEQIRQVRPALAHLYMSGYTTDAIVHRGIRTGDSPFIQKPFLPAALLAKVRSILDDRGRRSPVSTG